MDDEMNMSELGTEASKMQTFRVGLMAYGRAKDWEFSIDETTEGEDRWFAQIEGPSLSLYFEIPSPKTVIELALFLDSHEHATINDPKEIDIGHFNGNPVRILRDDEFRDRCFLTIRSNGMSNLRVTLSGDDLDAISNAVRQTRTEMHSNG